MKILFRISSNISLRRLISEIMTSSDWISIVLSGLSGVIIAFVFQWIINRRSAWRDARFSLLSDFRNLYDSVEKISKAPHVFNRFTFKFLFESESSIIKHYANCFRLKRKKLLKLAERTRRIQADLLLNADYEELLISLGQDSPYFNEFLTEIQQRISLLNVLLLNPKYIS